MAEGERRLYYPNEVLYGAVNHNNPSNVNPYMVYDTALPYTPSSHRASFPGTAPRALASEIDLSRYDAAVPGSHIDSIPVQSFVKSVHDQGWVPPRNRNPSGLRTHSPAPGWLGGGQSKRGAMSDPTPHHDMTGDMSSDNSTSEAGDSGYLSNMPTAFKDPALLNQSSLRNPSSGREYFDTHLTPGMNVSGATLPQFAHPAPPQSTVSDSRLHVPSKDARKGRPGKAALHACHTCGRSPKNLSDAKKHSLTHTKPYRCHEPMCARKDGFATENDLQRHRKSVHKVTPTVGSSAGFICAACLPPEGGKPPKFWPRRDNFKAHVKRKHSNWDETTLIERSMQDMRPDDVRTAPSIGQSSYRESVTGSTDHRRPGPATAPNGTDISRRLSHPDEYYLWPPTSMSEFPRAESSLLGGMGHATIADHSMLGAQELSTLAESTGADGLSILSGAAFEQGITSFMSTPPPDPQRVKRRRTGDEVPYRGSEQNPHVDLGGRSNMGAGTSDRQAAVNTSGNQGGHACSHCEKVIARECDFKKHMKRHTRPYGCTFPRCSKRFGSRNDWKRHESSQHYLSELWKCRRQNSDGTMCSHAPFPRLDHLKKHLATKHKDVHTPDINAECAKYRLGQNANDHFWCGFCKNLIKQDKTNPYAYAVRFQHIGDHFDKDHADIDDWVCIEKDEPKGRISSPAYLERLEEEDEEEEREHQSSIEPPTLVPAGFDEAVDIPTPRLLAGKSTPSTSISASLLESQPHIKSEEVDYAAQQLESKRSCGVKRRHPSETY